MMTVHFVTLYCEEGVDKIEDNNKKKTKIKRNENITTMMINF